MNATAVTYRSRTKFACLGLTIFGLSAVASGGLAGAASTKSSTKSATSSTAKSSTRSTSKPPTAPSRSKGSGSGANSSLLQVEPVAQVAPVVTAPRPRSSGTPIAGWSSLTRNDWPVRGDSIIAQATGKSIDVLRSPGDRSGAISLLQGRSMFGPVRLLALGRSDNWVKVAVPVRPNGTVGWVSADSVTLQRNQAHIQIELATNTLRVYEGEKVVIETKVAAGTGGTPTPTGLFFVKELVPQANPSGALGPFAFGLSGFSTVLNTFGDGQGTIGIHGTNAPGKLGGDVSHGCIRVRNADISAMTKVVPLGTPVEIVNTWNDLPQDRAKSEWLNTDIAAKAVAVPLPASVAAPSAQTAVPPLDPGSQSAGPTVPVANGQISVASATSSSSSSGSSASA